MLYNYNKFLYESKKSETLNEGFFDFFKKMFKKLQDMGEKVKDSKEIDKIIETAKKDVDKLFNSKINDLVDDAIQQLSKPSGTTQVQSTDTDKNVQQSGVTSGVTESIYYSYNDRLFEADLPAGIEAIKKEKNPIDEAIDQWKELVKTKMKMYLESKNTSVQFYAQAKLAELNEYIINKKITLYQKNKLAEKLLKSAQEEAKQVGKSYEEVMKKLENSLKGAKHTFKKGDLYRYKTKDGEENIIMFVDDKQAKTVRRGKDKTGKVDPNELPDAEVFTPTLDGIVIEYTERDAFKDQLKTLETK